MNTIIENTIKRLLAQITLESTPDAVLKITQAALNLAHTTATLSGRTQ